MSKRLKSIAVAVAMSLVCVPLAACGTVSAIETDGLNIVGGNSSAYEPESAVTEIGESEGQDAADPTDPEEPEQTEPEEPELTEPTEPEEEPDESVETTDVFSEVYDAYLWDGNLVKAGWADTESEKAKRPDSYYVDKTAKTITIGSASALAYFAHQCALEVNNGFEGYTVTLECNVDLGGNRHSLNATEAERVWIPASFLAADSASLFKGTFDGNGYTIYNLGSQDFYNNIQEVSGNVVVSVGDEDSVDVSMPLGQNDEYVYGLFGTVGSGAKFINVKLVDVQIDLAQKTVGTHEIKAVAGALVGYAIGNLTVTDCVAGTENVLTNADQRAKNYIKNASSAGGLVGYACADQSAEEDEAEEGEESAKGVTVKNSVNYLDINYTAPIVDDDDEDEEDVEGADETSLVLDTVYAGGIFGIVDDVNVLTIEDCENYGYIAGAIVGGAAAYIAVGSDADHAISVTGFKNSGAIVGEGSVIYAAGVVGYTKVTAAEEAEATVDVVITDCFNYGNVTVDQGEQTEVIVGGIVANVSLSAKSGKLAFEHNFNYGDIAGHENVGKTAGLIGSLSLSDEYGKENVILSGGNCGRVTGHGAIGCIDGTDKYTVNYLINAYAGIND